MMKIYHGILMLFGVVWLTILVTASVNDVVQYQINKQKNLVEENLFQSTKEQKIMKDGACIITSTIVSETEKEKFVKVELPQNKCFYFKIDDKKEYVTLIGCEIEEHTYEEIQKFKMKICVKTMGELGGAIAEHLFDV